MGDNMKRTRKEIILSKIIASVIITFILLVYLLSFSLIIIFGFNEMGIMLLLSLCLSPIFILSIIGLIYINNTLKELKDNSNN